MTKRRQLRAHKRHAIGARRGALGAGSRPSRATTSSRRGAVVGRGAHPCRYPRPDVAKGQGARRVSRGLRATCGRHDPKTGVPWARLRESEMKHLCHKAAAAFVPIEDGSPRLGGPLLTPAPVDESSKDRFDPALHPTQRTLQALEKLKEMGVNEETTAAAASVAAAPPTVSSGMAQRLSALRAGAQRLERDQSGSTTGGGRFDRSGFSSRR